jgi:protein TonB
LIAGIVAVGVTFALFVLMFKLISSGGGKNQDLEAISGIRFGPVDIPDEVTRRSRRVPPKPPPPKKPPPPPKMEIANQQVISTMPKLDMPDLDLPLVGGEGMFIGNFGTVDKTEEGDIIPLVVIRPMYPREAAMKGIEGWVKVEFTITELGTVKDPRVLDSDPPRIFNREALRAILKWKFKPRVVDGVAIERTATQIIGFDLEGELQ